MQAIKLVIPGKYWDSQLYAGKLYLFSDSGELTVVNWDAAINDILKDNNLEMAMRTAFLESDIFYEKGVQLILKDHEIKETLLNRFKSLARMNLQLNLEGVNSSHITRMDNPLPFPHVDSEIYYQRLYVSLKEGVFYSECNGGNIKDNSVKLWDIPTFDITASKSYTTLAFAAGSEGLFQQKLEFSNKNEEQKKPVLISSSHCTTCKWSDFNIYATSHVHNSFFASFKKIQDKDNKRKYTRRFEKIISAQEIFNDGGFSWGVQDKLYVYRDQGIDAIKYSSRRDGEPIFDRIGRLEIDSWKGEVVSAEVTPFGTVIECENAIVIIQSDNEIFTIPGEPVNWRVFSKSHHYTNQLHIIHEDQYVG
jgi:hypothetical protein